MKDAMGWSERTVTVNREDLLATLKGNREQHRRDYIESMQGYCQTASEALAAIIAALSSTKPYDVAIAMAEWEVGDTIELTQSQFQLCHGRLGLEAKI